MALQPVTFRPISPVKPVSRKPDEETARKLANPKRPRRGRRLDPGQGENLDTWA